MKVKVQLCWNGTANGLCFRALTCGGVLVPTGSGRWDRKIAKRMKDAIVSNSGADRNKIRFFHV